MIKTKEIVNKIDIACERYKKIHKSKKQKFYKLDEWLEEESTIFEQELSTINNHKGHNGYYILISIF